MRVKYAKGFTLIELMIVIAIVGILAAIALPSFSGASQKARRTDAKTALETAATAEERWYFQNNVYSGTVTDVGGASSPEGYYTISVDVSAATCGTINTCYTLTATPVASGPQADDNDCKTFTLTHTGARDATGDDTSRCW